MTQSTEIAKIKALLNQNIYLRQDLIQKVIERDFQGNTSAFGRSLELDSQPHRKTILRWAQAAKNLPKSPQRLLALGQALDIDPFLLLHIDSDIIESVCALASWNMTWGSVHKALAFMNGLFALTPEYWPPQEIADYFDDHWYLLDFVHDPSIKRNYYKRFQIQAEIFYQGDGQIDQKETHRNPQAWYLAYRDISLRSGVPEAKTYWRPFGILKLEQEQIELLHLTGLIQKPEHKADQGRFIFETFYGQGAHEFRVASLHPFELLDADENSSLPVVRFGFPE